MNRMRLAGLFSAALAVVALQTTPVLAQKAGQTLGTVKIPKSAMANGQALAAGSYSVRLADGSVNPAVGQTPEGMQWVEFVQSGQVKGRELATVVAGPEAKDVLKGKGPAPGGAVVHTLKGNDYMRVWINHSGKNYLIHLTTTPA